jgi:hypothetical protein
MKPCPECGEAMRLAAGQWIHVRPGRCHTVTLRATTEEIQRHASVAPGPSDRPHQTAGTRDGRQPAPPDRGGGWRFGYLTPESAAPSTGD